MIDTSFETLNNKEKKSQIKAVTLLEPKSHYQLEIQLRDPYAFFSTAMIEIYGPNIVLFYKKCKDSPDDFYRLSDNILEKMRKTYAKLFEKFPKIEKNSYTQQDMITLYEFYENLILALLLAAIKNNQPPVILLGQHHLYPGLIELIVFEIAYKYGLKNVCFETDKIGLMLMQRDRRFCNLTANPMYYLHAIAKATPGIEVLSIENFAARALYSVLHKVPLDYNPGMLARDWSMGKEIVQAAVKSGTTALTIVICGRAHLKGLLSKDSLKACEVLALDTSVSETGITLKKPVADDVKQSHKIIQPPIIKYVLSGNHKELHDQVILAGKQLEEQENSSPMDLRRYDEGGMVI